MQRYLILRTAQALLALWIVTIVVFGLTRVSGDPLDVFVPIEATPADVDRIRIRWGLDKPLVVQYGVFIGNAFQGDLGDSLKFPGSKAGKLVIQRMAPTLQLAGISIAISLLIAVPIGVLSAVKKDTIFDFVGKTIALTGQSVPSFWLGIVLMWFFAVQLGLLPTSGKGGIRHIILPAITLGWFQVAAIMRLVRSAMLETQDSEYVKLARIKGLSEASVVWKHCFRNAAIPPLTYFGIILANMMTGSLTTEVVFNWPGTGLLAFQAVVSRDTQLIQAVVLVFASMFIFLTLIVDVLYAYLDPRIRYN
jgi:peptide/nickel transport system permease protein